MKIKFKELNISNFFSLGSIHIDLENKGFVLVEGINKSLEDKAKSNGSGKSSIFEAIIWCLTGDTIRGTKDVVNFRANDGACVETLFTVDNTEYQITRFRDHSKFGNLLKISVNGQDVSGKGLRESEKILNEYLPDLTAQLLGSVIVLGQGLPQRFTNNTPSGRKEVLEILSKSDFMIEDIKNKLSLRRTQLNTDVRNIENTILRNETSINMHNKTIELRKSSIEEFECTKLNFNHIILIKQEEKQKLELDKNKKVEDKNNFILSTQNYNLDNQLNILKEERIRVDSEYQSLSFNIKTLESEILREKQVLTICPTCKRALDGVHQIDTTEKENEVLRLKSELKIISENKKQAEQKYQVVDNQINSERQQEKYLEQEIRNIENLILIKDKEIQSEQSLYNSNFSSIKLWETEIMTAQIEIQRLTEENIKQRTDLDSMNIRLDSVQKLISLASRDFRGYLLDDIIKFINIRAKRYAKILFNSDKIEFKGDGNQIWIGYDERSYENLSGGEKQKVDLIIQFSLRDMLISVMNFSCNILVLDELFDNLDAYGCESLINLITTELSDIETVFIITHHSDISIPYDSQIILCKDANSITSLL